MSDRMDKVDAVKRAVESAVGGYTYAVVEHPGNQYSCELLWTVGRDVGQPENLKPWYQDTVGIATMDGRYWECNPQPYSMEESDEYQEALNSRRVIEVLVAAGLVSQEKVDQAFEIVSD